MSGAEQYDQSRKYLLELADKLGLSFG
jgi:hypothetical protein